MSNLDKRKMALKLLAETNIFSANYAPWGLKLLWRFGIDCPPPHFVKFSTLSLVYGLYFASFMALFMSVQSYFFSLHTALLIPLSALLAGLAFGLMMATYYWLGRRKYQLPLWHQLSGDAS